MPTSDSSGSTARAKKKKPLSHTLLAGGTAGFVESSICHPLDTIKTRMQLRNNHIESVSNRIRHSLVEPTVLHVRHSLMEPALRLRHSFSESPTTAVAARMKHSLVEPANLVKLRRHSFAEPALMNLDRVDGSGSTTIDTTNSPSNTIRNGDYANTHNARLAERIVTTKSKSSTVVANKDRNAAKCWWNLPKQNHAKTSNRSYQTKKTDSAPSRSKHTTTTNAATSSNLNNKKPTAWWNWHKNSSVTIAGRGQSSKSAAWWQPMNGFNAGNFSNLDGRRRTHTTFANTRNNARITRRKKFGPIQTAQKIIRKEGIRSLYKGLSAVYVGIIPKMAIRFVSFEHYKDTIRMHTPLGDRVSDFTAGLLSGLTEAVLIVTPAEVCKIRMQSQRHSLLDPAEASARKYGNVVQTAATIVREEGYSALYKGIVPTMLRQGCNQAVNFTAYNSMKTYWLDRQRQQYLQNHGDTRYNNGRLQQEIPEPPQQLPGMVSMLIGGLSGAMGPIVNNPLDVVKTRLQKQNIAKGRNTPKYTGLVQACFKIANEEGAGALWKGITPRLMRIVPGQAITFTTYEAVCRWL